MALLTTLSTKVDGNVLVIELTRADKGNALNRQLQSEIAQAWRDFEANEELRVAVLQGAPNVFSIGHDVAQLAADSAASPVPDDALFALKIGKPVIAAIEGPCYGLGFELALSCDLRIAGEGAMFGFADPNLYVPYGVASVLLPRMTLVGKSLDMLLAGKLLDAHAMREARLVTDVTAKGGAAAAALDIARALAARFTNAAAFRKRQIWSLSGLPLPAAMNFARMPQR